MSEKDGSSCREPIIKSLPPTARCILKFFRLIHGTLFSGKFRVTICSKKSLAAASWICVFLPRS